MRTHAHVNFTRVNNRQCREGLLDVMKLNLAQLLRLLATLDTLLDSENPPL